MTDRVTYSQVRRRLLDTQAAMVEAIQEAAALRERFARRDLIALEMQYVMNDPKLDEFNDLCGRASTEADYFISRFVAALNALANGGGR